MKDLLKNKKVVALYLLWVLLNIILFMIGLAGERRSGFFPFAYLESPNNVLLDGTLSYKLNLWLSYYDFTELLIYTVLPGLAAFVYYTFKTNKK